MPDGRRLFQTVIPNIAPKQRGQIPTHRFGNFSAIGCCRRSNAIGISPDHLRQASKRRHKRDRALGQLATSWLDSHKLFLTTENGRSVHSELLCPALGKYLSRNYQDTARFPLRSFKVVVNTTLVLYILLAQNAGISHARSFQYPGQGSCGKKPVALSLSDAIRFGAFLDIFQRRH